jgi:short-chain Z-isoprenyl diphosphate synthase
VARIRQVLERPLYRMYERRLAVGLAHTRVPEHIGIILDGHRRHARSAGHVDYRAAYREGTDRFVDFLRWCHDLRIPAVTGWVLSTDNLKRPADELGPLFEVLGELCDRVGELSGELDYSLRFVGSLDLLPTELAKAAKAAEERSPVTGSWRLTIALGYGGRQEIVDACRDLVGGLVERGVDPERLAEHISTDAISAHLYAPDLPDPDLVIRTSGESRLSGFLMWQAAYAEYVFVDVVWPRFRRVDFLRALRDFADRDRRYGR